MARINEGARFFRNLNFDKESYWCNKANVFSLLCVILNHTKELNQKGVADTKAALEFLEAHLPANYVIAAKEAVNNKRERSVRNKILCKAILGIDEG